MKEKINRNDIHGEQLYEGDIVAECKVGEKIWEDKGIILTRPLGIIVAYKPTPKATKYLKPEETDCYNVVQIRKGTVRLTDDATNWMVDHLGDENKISELNISKYDGDFYAWDNIERIGSVYEMDICIK